MNNDTITIDLDKTRTLKFRRKELKLLEKALGNKISKFDPSELGIDELSKVIHIGLLHEDPELTFAKVEEMCDEYPYYGVLIQKAMEAFALAMEGPKPPENSDKQNGNEQKN